MNETESTDTYTSGRYRNTPPCPNCGSAAYCRGTEVVDYCTDCKTLFKDDADEWSLRPDTDRSESDE